MLVPKLLLTPIKIRIFGPKTAKIGPKSAFSVILGQILPFLHILSNARPKNNVNKVPRWVFRYVGNKAYDFSSKKKDFCPKRPNLAQNWHFWLIWARPCRFFRCPVGGSVGGWARAGCISQDTYLLYGSCAREEKFKFERKESSYKILLMCINKQSIKA